jgi:hypothetical protein
MTTVGFLLPYPASRRERVDSETRIRKLGTGFGNPHWIRKLAGFGNSPGFGNSGSAQIRKLTWIRKLTSGFGNSIKPPDSETLLDSETAPRPGFGNPAVLGTG